MRIYQSFREATSEVQRDLKEMGINIHTHSYQNKDISHNKEMATLELQNYIYTVLNPELKDCNPSQPWADSEFRERIYMGSGEPINPGEAWKSRSEIWEEFLDSTFMQFDYTYNERYKHQLQTVIRTLKQDNSSRQAFLTVWNPTDIKYTGGERRIPCSLGYWFNIRGGKLNVTYLQRSCDFATHFQNDIYLTHRLQQWIANQIGVSDGHFTHWLGSMHIFKKDVEHVF